MVATTCRVKAKTTRIRTRSPANLTGGAGVLIWGSILRGRFPRKTRQSGAAHGQYDADPARSGPGVIATDFLARGPGIVAVRPRHHRPPPPPPQKWGARPPRPR